MMVLDGEGNVVFKADISKEELVALELTRIWANNRNSDLVMYRDDIYNAYQYYIGLLKRRKTNGNV